MVRYVVVFFLGALFLLAVGVALGFISVDFDTINGPQLSLASSFAAIWGCYDDGCESVEEDEPIYYGGAPQEVREETIYYDGPEVDPCSDPYGCDDVDEIDEIEYSRDTDAPYQYRSDLWFEDEWIEDGWYGGRNQMDSWVAEDEWIEDTMYYGTRNQTPWYVSSFPGIGSMLQRIIPGGGGVSRPPVVPRPTYPQPSCWISANPMSVEDGGSSTLQWSSFNATRASLTEYGSVPLSGLRVAQNIRNNRQYQLTISGQGGSGNCYTQITVRAGSTRPGCFISAYPRTISSGESTSLAWGSENASSAYLSDVGAVSPQGGTYVAPRQTTTYTLTVFSTSGVSNTCAAEIGVLP